MRPCDGVCQRVGVAWCGRTGRRGGWSRNGELPRAIGPYGACLDSWRPGLYDVNALNLLEPLANGKRRHRRCSCFRGNRRPSWPNLSHRASLHVGMRPSATIVGSDPVGSQKQSLATHRFQAVDPLRAAGRRCASSSAGSCGQIFSTVLRCSPVASWSVASTAMRDAVDGHVALDDLPPSSAAQAGQVLPRQWK